MGRKLDKIIVVDVESTCWKGKPSEGQINEIIEVGLGIINKQSYIVKPKLSIISNFCTELTSITQEMVDNGEDFDQVCEKIRYEYGTDSRIWASFGEYDKNQFRKCCSRFNVKYPFSDMHWNIKSIASIFYGWPEMGMDNLLNKLGLKLEGRHHRGVDDAYNVAKILIDILRRGR